MTRGGQMSRELNPDLFPELNRPVLKPERETDTTVAPVRSEEWRLLVAQVDQIKRKFKEQEAKLEMLNSRVTEVVGASKVKFERLAGVSQRLDEMVRSGLQDLATKQSQMMGRLNERKVGDAKIQELVDRHNQLVQTFEARLVQMQKLISEQEMQLMTSRAELKEAQREIARLKRL